METYFTREHEWIRVDGPFGTVGITAYAVEQLGDITFMELPPIGKSVRQAEMLCSVESVKAASDIYAPLAGTVIEVNRALDAAPEIVNQSPEEEGWIVRMEVEDLSGASNLMSRPEYDQYVRGLA